MPRPDELERPVPPPNPDSIGGADGVIGEIRSCSARMSSRLLRSPKPPAKGSLAAEFPVAKGLKGSSAETAAGVDPSVTGLGAFGFGGVPFGGDKVAAFASGTTGDGADLRGSVGLGATGLAAFGGEAVGLDGTFCGVRALVVFRDAKAGEASSGVGAGLGASAAEATGFFAVFSAASVKTF